METEEADAEGKGVYATNDNKVANSKTADEDSEVLKSRNLLPSQYLDIPNQYLETRATTGITHGSINKTQYMY